ncbi:hypothetical protein [Ornithobacterium rhinotracheale]|uniref:Uncharacterized protein n=1 Tax=Ornithobacterium rhinotracheale (strain ATCC 51463 / DSM 15997 / CCUG 23171 / CIP 104009 / LMG 9086) TaxID=867902 RepID=I3ZXG9_ORNRL|nr:hypothetical protein [Ornithobacterium rhinotracheale]AFL96403.1 hypothetical protein Ornrh_0181 [Ornithobacterium rhinotracheale DSM 15997]AIQ00265.1 hypothetical protein Q785_01010 [Ornithobacterium rhinotracheale ORT-UMN 88]KGB67799.1 hypothetical protein Q787_00975 [Ornithobacterium rhinotracheale H06-030791]MCK0194731.1 hypothetical protein [Ornithobacterium rhinotracheale]MCK0200802.1 hypothetical protein [Ornithobacterium rhinotracheale]
MKKLFISLGLMASTMMFAQEKKTSSKNMVFFNQWCLKEYADMVPCITFSENNIDYKLLFGKFGDSIDLNQPIKLIEKHTQSPNFKTPEGYTIENTYSDVKKYGNLKGYPGWAYYVELPSGWCAAFYKTKPKDNDKISFFLKKYN